eukprot:UN01982
MVKRFKIKGRNCMAIRDAKFEIQLNPTLTSIFMHFFCISYDSSACKRRISMLFSRVQKSQSQASF